MKNEDNPKYGIEGGNDTKDKVFLLSIEEVLRYFDPDPDVCDPARQAKVTAYAKAQGGVVYSKAEFGWYNTTDCDGNGFWWLRSSGGIWRKSDEALRLQNKAVAPLAGLETTLTACKKGLRFVRQPQEKILLFFYGIACVHIGL